MIQWRELFEQNFQRSRQFMRPPTLSDIKLEDVGDKVREVSFSF